MKFECKCCYGDHPTATCPKAKQLLDPEDAIMTVDDFFQQVKAGCFIDYDGSGCYSDGVYMYRNEPAQPSVIYKHGINRQFSHVAWFNK